MKPEDFIKMIAPAAIASMHRSRIPASFTVAQAALESNWGTSKLAVVAHNLFGVKASKKWTGAIITLPTIEYIQGKKITVDANWREYSSFEECIADRELFFKQNPRYAPAFEQPSTGIAFAHLIAKCGYATDPQYADKISSLIRARKLADLDNQNEHSIESTS